MRDVTNLPVWLLDVDGVINVDSPQWGQKLATGRATALGHAYGLRWAPKLIDAIRDIHTSGLAEVTWCTTWCAWADQLETLWDLPKFNRAFTDEDSRYTRTRRLKMKSALGVIKVGRPLIWTDDDAFMLHGLRFDELTRDRRSLLIKPYPTTGLKPRHIDDIRKFCERMRDE